jgi:hypothetical protein
VDSKDRVYIVDGASNPRVQIFDTDDIISAKLVLLARCPLEKAV